MNSNRNNQKGGVSLFIVIFTCLLVTIVTVSFINIMIRNQQQATNTDLSSSAYDSAMAGVEDAKRLAIVYRDCKDADDTTSSTCAPAVHAVENQACDSIQQSGMNVPGSSSSEVKIQSASGDTNSAALDQAYTCVKITYDTDDVQRAIRDGETQMIPLRAADGSDPDKKPDAFDRIKITWKGSKTSPYTTLPTSVALPQKNAWGAQPSILRTQVLQTASTFTLSDFDDSSAGSDMNTAFLYPYNAGTVVDFDVADPRPNTAPRAPVTVVCNDNDPTPVVKYECSTTIELKTPVGGSVDNRKNAFILVSSVYNGADYKLELFNGATPVKFDGVQPRVDATGRANDLFRRVDARIEFNAGQFNYPSAALDLNGNLCKAFAVTDDTATYDPGPSCTP